MKRHLLHVHEGRSAHGAGDWSDELQGRVGATHVAVVRGVRREGLPAVAALERPLARVLADVRPQDAGRSEGLKNTKQTNTKKYRNTI